MGPEGSSGSTAAPRTRGVPPEDSPKSPIGRERNSNEGSVRASYPDGAFSSEQARITREFTEAEQLVRGAQDQFAAMERTILRAIDLAENMHKTYLRSPARVRRLINQAWWSDIKIDDRPEPTRARLTEHVSALFARAPVAIASRVSRAAEVLFSGVGLSMNGLVLQPLGV
jgi:hypothetical protein